MHRSEQIVGSIDVRVQRGELVLKRIADETLGGEMVALLRLDGTNHPVQAGKTLQRSGMKFDIVEQVPDAPEAMLRVLQGYPPHNPVHTVALFEQEFRQEGSILTRDPGDQRHSFFH